jgi:hypothetical protein
MDTVIYNPTVTKGYLINTQNNAKINFQYNPEKFNDKQSVNYSQIKSPGMSYPRYQYVGGEVRQVSFELFLDATGWSRDDMDNSPIRGMINYLNNFTPDANSGSQFTAPPTLIFGFGWFVKECVLTNFDTDYQMFTPDLQPLRAIVTLTLSLIQ